MIKKGYKMKKDFLNAMNFRHACKVFDKNKKISEDDFNYILEVGRISPSSFGFEPWKFLVVQNEDLRAKLKEATWGAQGTLPTCSHFVIMLGRKYDSIKYDSDYVQHIMNDIQKLPTNIVKKKGEIFKQFQEKDFDLLDNKKLLFDWSGKQVYIALANMMTGAAMIGVDSCPIEGFDMGVTDNMLQKDFGIDTDEFGACVMVAFGYRENEQPKKTRQNMNDISKWYR